MELTSHNGTVAWVLKPGLSVPVAYARADISKRSYIRLGALERHCLP